MSFKMKIQGSGIPALAAETIQGKGANGLVATGSTQATALPIGNDLNTFSSVPSGTGCIIPPFPAMVQGDSMAIVNGDPTNALLVYPPVGGQINALSVNAGYSLAAGKFVEIYQTGTTTYISNLSAG